MINYDIVKFFGACIGYAMGHIIYRYIVKDEPIKLLSRDIITLTLITASFAAFGMGVAWIFALIWMHAFIVIQIFEAVLLLCLLNYMLQYMAIKIIK